MTVNLDIKEWGARFLEPFGEDVMESCDICQGCGKTIEFDVDGQEMVDLDIKTQTWKWVHSECLEDYEKVSCGICGDCHEIDSIPLSCESGDGS